MDIIVAHRQGLVEQLEETVTSLAGRSRDHGQRAVVLHHLYDHSGGQHVWGLAEAREALRIVAAIRRLRSKTDRWWWFTADRERARHALERLADALGGAAMARTAAAYRAYRLSSAKALRAEAEQRLPEALLAALEECHAARRSGSELSTEARQRLCEETEQLAASAVNPAKLDAAWAAVGATGIGRSARRRLGPARLSGMRARDERRGWAKVEREFRRDTALPAAFRSNPAQHFYALQQAQAERRRQLWREACDREPDAFELAA